jgi:hypothetical protein
MIGIEVGESMRHWAPHHNPDEMGESDPSGGDFVVMKKNIRCNPGDRVWLLSRRGKRGSDEYLRCRTFLADSRGPNGSGRFPKIPNCVKGSDGKALVPPVAINKNEEWFKVLFRVTQRLHRGLTQIKEEEVVQGLSRLAKLP